MSRRLLYFYILGNFSTVISGVLAYAFDGVSGKGGLAGWQWYVNSVQSSNGQSADDLNPGFFLVEGIITVIFGVALFFLLPDCKASSTPKLTLSLPAELVPPTAKMAHRKREGFRFKLGSPVMLLEKPNPTSIFGR